MDWALMIAVLLTLALANTLYGNPLPFNAETPLVLLVTAVRFSAYLYLARTLFRLPFAVVQMRRRYRHARDHYALEGQAALLDGFYRGLLDRRRWESGLLAMVDRMALIAVVWLATHPRWGGVLVSMLGSLGMIVLLVTYLYTGRFALLLGDGISGETNPFPNVPNLRPPDDTMF